VATLLVFVFACLPLLQIRKLVKAFSIVLTLFHLYEFSDLQHPKNGKNNHVDSMSSKCKFYPFKANVKMESVKD